MPPEALTLDPRTVARFVGPQAHGLDVTKWIAPVPSRNAKFATSRAVSIHACILAARSSQLRPICDISPLARGRANSDCLGQGLRDGALYTRQKLSNRKPQSNPSEVKNEATGSQNN